MKVSRVSMTALGAAGLALMIAMVATLGGCGGASSDRSGTSSNGLLPRNYVVLLNLVNQYFNAITQQSSSGKDSTAQRDPTATRAVFFVSDDNSLLVTITADRYRDISEALAA